MLRIGIKLYYFLFALLFVSLYAATGCYKFEGDQTVPAYISIDGINLDTYYPEEGTNSSDITDIWVYVDDVLIGIYEFHESDSAPATFPVLATGKHKLEIRPGIKLNGISSTRVPYPFYQPILYDEFDFIPGTVHDLGELTTSYFSNIKFEWFEDFEQPEISIESASWSDTMILRTNPVNNPVAFLSPNSRYSGVINLDSDRTEYGGTTFNSFPSQTPGTVIMLEMNFKTNNYVTVGLLIRDTYDIIEKDLIILNHSSEWKKIYINLGANLSLYPQSIDYKIIFRAKLDGDVTNASIYLDNFKIVHRDLENE